VEGNQPDEFLKALGLGLMRLDRIRLGKGVLGRLSTNLMSVLTVVGIMGVIALARGYEGIAIACLAICASYALLTHVSTMLFAYKNPAAALLEGSEYVRLKEIEMGAKGLPSPPSQPNIEAPMIEVDRVDGDAVQPEREMGEDGPKY
jgi:hypothetical protein